jgi:glycosyltransferase involved in cell wall biosynthesis
VEGLASRNHSQWVVAPPGAPLLKRLESLDADINLLPINLKRFGPFSAVLTLRRIVQDNQMSLCTVHTSHAHNTAVLLTLRQPSIPVVVHRRVDFQINKHYLSYWKYKRPNVTYIAISKGVKKVLMQGGVEGEKIHVVHSCYDPRRWDASKDPDKIRSKFNIPSKVPVIGNVAQLVDHKGHRFLLQAAPEILKQFPEVRFLICGEGKERSHLEELIQSLHLQDHVHLAGYQEDLNDFWAVFDCFVLPSHLEGLCTSILDAMHNRVPVVACATGGVPDIVHDGETGLLVEPKNPNALGQAVICLLGDNTLRESLVTKAEVFVRDQFTPARMVEQTEAVYHQLL